MNRVIFLAHNLQAARFEASALGIRDAQPFTSIQQILSIGSGTTVVMVDGWQRGRSADEVAEIMYRLRIAQQIKGTHVIEQREAHLLLKEGA